MKIALVQCRESFYNPRDTYSLPILMAKNRPFHAIALGLLLTLSGTGQEPVYAPSEEPAWSNPYPGLGNVSPGSAGTLSSVPTSLPPSVTLYADEDENHSDLSPTDSSTELYLSRFPNNKRSGVFQKGNFNILWVPDNGSRGFGMTELDISAMFALPMPSPDSPLLISPKFSTAFIDRGDWNETFHTTGISVRWMRPIVKDKLTADLGFNVFYSGDFDVRTSKAMRFPAHLAGIWQFNPRTKIVFGVVYTDRRDSYNVFPMAGLIWTPNEDISVELIIPRLRVAQRIRWFGSAAGDEQSDWIYTAFEFGSNSWGYEPVDGRFEYRDVRLLLGYERRTRFGMMLGLEVGYMCDRHVRIERVGNDHLSDSVFLRLRSSF